MRSARELDCRFLFERFDEFDQVAGFGRCCSKNMEVIRHDAVGVNKKFAIRGVFAEPVNDPLRDARVCTERASIIEAERDEVQSPAAIISGRQTDVLAPQISGCCHGTYISTVKIWCKSKHAALKAAALH